VERPTRCVAGIDIGTFSTPSYVAWLVDREFVLDLYQPTREVPLPPAPPSLPPAEWIAMDAPQGLPAAGAQRRTADRDANTPTRRLPSSREELGRWKAFGGLIVAGVEIFWGVYELGLGRVAGLPADGRSGPWVLETYPRYEIRRLWPDLRIPSKHQAPVAYVEAVWGRLQASGYHCHGVARPTVDQVDAMLCAVTAEACAASGDLPGGTVGTPPRIDLEERVLREGFIVSP
jgi:hypothetical protein